MARRRYKSQSLQIVERPRVLLVLGKRPFWKLSRREAVEHGVDNEGERRLRRPKG